MKLHISRTQPKGSLGEARFRLEAKVELTAEEAALVARYGADQEVLGYRQVRHLLTGRTERQGLTIGSLAAGQVFECVDIQDVLETEDNLRKACTAFKAFLKLKQGFGGRDVIDFD
jgi:hypothetical protein